MHDQNPETVTDVEAVVSLENADNQDIQGEEVQSEEVEAGAETDDQPSQEGKNDEAKKIEILVSPPVKIRGFEDVKQVVEDHAAWIESVVNPRKDIRGGRANFKGNDLSGFNLAGVDLRGATFTNCICRGTIFTGANLSGAIFNRADLSGADFRGAKLKRAQFEHATLIGADWDDANVVDANFRFAKRDDKDPLPVTEDEVSEEVSQELAESAELETSSIEGATSLEDVENTPLENEPVAEAPSEAAEELPK